MYARAWARMQRRVTRLARSTVMAESTCCLALPELCDCASDSVQTPFAVLLRLRFRSARPTGTRDRERGSTALDDARRLRYSSIFYS